MPEIQLKLLYFTLNINFSKKIFFRPLLLNETSTTSLSVFKKNLLKFISPFPNNVFNCHNCKGIKYLTRLRLGISHINSNLVFKILWIHFVRVTLMFFFTFLCFLIKDAPSWMQSMISTVLCQILMIRYWLIFFFLVKLLYIYLQTSSYLMQQWITSYQRKELKKVFFRYFVIFCYIFISLIFFCVIMSSFFETIHSYSFSF